jgi:hypothetical protein
MNAQREFSPVFPSMEVTDLVCDRSLHGKCRIWIEYARPRIYIAPKIYAAELFAFFYFDDETCISGLIVLKIYLAKQAQKGVSYTALLCFAKQSRSPPSE